MQVRGLLLALVLGGAACSERSDGAQSKVSLVPVVPPTEVQRGALARGERLKFPDGAQALRSGAATFTASPGSELEGEQRLRVHAGSVTVREVADGGVAEVQLAFGQIAGLAFSAQQDPQGVGRVRALGAPATFRATDGTHVALKAFGALVYDGQHFEEVDLQPHALAFAVAPASGLAAPEGKPAAADVELVPTRALALFADGQQRLVSLSGAKGRVSRPTLEGATERWVVSLEEGALLVMGRYGFERRVDFVGGPSLVTSGGLARVARCGAGHTVEALVGPLSVRVPERAALELAAGEAARLGCGGAGVVEASRVEGGLALVEGRQTVYAQEVTLAQWGPGRLSLEVRGRRLVDSPKRGGGAAPLIPGDAFSFTWSGGEAVQRGTVAVQLDRAEATGVLRVPVRDEAQTELEKPPGQELQLQFRWGPNTRATSYRLELFRAATPAVPIASLQVKEPRAEVSAPVGLGEYEWLALPLDAAGEPLTAGHRRRLTVVEWPVRFRPRLWEPRWGQLVGSTVTVRGALPPRTAAFLGGVPILVGANGHFSMTIPTPTAPLLSLSWDCDPDAAAICSTLVRRIARAPP